MCLLRHGPKSGEPGTPFLYYSDGEKKNKPQTPGRDFRFFSRLSLISDVRRSSCFSLKFFQISFSRDLNSLTSFPTLELIFSISFLNVGKKIPAMINDPIPDPAARKPRS